MYSFRLEMLTEETKKFLLKSAKIESFQSTKSFVTHFIFHRINWAESGTEKYWYFTYVKARLFSSFLIKIK